MFSKAWNSAITALPVVALAASGLTFAPKAVEAQTTAPTIGQCVAPGVLQGQLIQLHQKYALNGTQSGIFVNSQNKEYSFNTGLDYTTTPDGTFGYIVQQCKDDFGQATGQLRAQKAVTSVKVYPPATKPLVEMYIQGNKQVADKACMTISKETGACSFHNDMIDKGYKNKGQVMYQATSADSGSLLTVFKYPDGKASLLSTDITTGATTGLAVMTKVDYSNFVKTVGYNIPAGASSTPLAAVTAPQAVLR